MSQNPGITEQVEAVRAKSPVDAAAILSTLPSNDIQFILSRLPYEQAMEVASHLAEVSGPEGLATKAVISGVEETIGELMTPVPAILPAVNTVAETLAFLVKSIDLAEISYIFATENNQLIGVVGMRDLILAKPSETLADIMIREPFAFTPDVPVRDAIGEVLYRHYPVYPVVNEARELVGVIHGWKLYERIASELSAQAGLQYGVDKDEQVSTPITTAFRMRHPWLLVNLATAFVAAFVVGSFEETISQVVALAAFLPVLARTEWQYRLSGAGHYSARDDAGAIAALPDPQIATQGIVAGGIEWRCGWVAGRDCHVWLCGGNGFDESVDAGCGRHTGNDRCLHRQWY